MDDRVIEAAAMAILTEFGEVPYYRDMAESAIMAALRELAPDVRAAVERFEEAVAASVARPSAEHRTTRGATKLALLALVVIED